MGFFRKQPTLELTSSEMADLISIAISFAPESIDKIGPNATIHKIRAFHESGKVNGADSFYVRLV